jgi:hypothetical protein
MTTRRWDNEGIDEYRIFSLSHTQKIPVGSIGHTTLLGNKAKQAQPKEHASLDGRRFTHGAFTSNWLVVAGLSIELVHALDANKVIAGPPSQPMTCKQLDTASMHHTPVSCRGSQVCPAKQAFPCRIHNIIVDSVVLQNSRLPRRIHNIMLSR